MARRKAAEGNDDRVPMTDEQRERFIWQPEDLTVFRDGVQIHPEPERKECGCGCGEPVVGQRSAFRPGHDARHKSRLLTAARSGDAAARAELIERGWATDESIDSAKAKLSEEERAERRRAKLEATLAKARATVAELEAQVG